MPDLKHLYLIRKSGEVIPYHNCTAAPDVADLTIQSGEWRNEFKLEDLQTDLVVKVDNGAGQYVPSTISPIRGGYTLDEAAALTVEAGYSGGLMNKVGALAADLKICAPDSVLGKDLRQTALSVTHWKFTVQFGAGTMVLHATIQEGDAIAPAPPIGYTDENAPVIA